MNLLRLLVFLIFCPTAFSQRIDSVTIPFKGVGRTIYIKLPVNYDRSKKRYPVLYLTDAQNLFSDKTAFAGEWRVDESIDSLRADVIVVGIAHGNEKRFEELTAFAHPKYGGGNAPEFLSFITGEVMPFVNKRYRTRRQPRHTGIGGSSLGGLFALYALQSIPHHFSRAMVFSPSLWLGEEYYSLIEKSKYVKGKIYLMAGDSESNTMVDEVQKLQKILEKRLRPGNLKTEIIPGGHHNEKLWRSRFPNAYLWLFKVSRFF
mgnify:CR=1 FL=1